jgi:uncharacterized protein (DUF1499 family)
MLSGHQPGDDLCERRMNPIAWLVSLILPACGFAGADGLPPPQPMDSAQIVRPASPNTALAAPPGFRPPPDITTPPYKLPPDRLFALIRDVAAGQPRTYQAALYPDRLQAQYVARSALFNFPDLIMVQVIHDAPDSSTLIVYSRSVYGQSDLGVNRRRVETWLAALQSKMTSPSER